MPPLSTYACMQLSSIVIKERDAKVAMALAKLYHHYKNERFVHKLSLISHVFQRLKNMGRPGYEAT